MKVMFYEAFAEEEDALRKLIPSWMEASFTAQTIQEHHTEECPATVISIRTQSVIPASWFNDLEGVLSRSQGYDHLEKMAPRGPDRIVWGYLEAYCSRAVAEQALMMAMALLRRLKQQIRQFEFFHRDHLSGQEFKGRKALVVGVGRIGEELVHLCRGVGMNVLGVDIDHRLSHLDYITLPEGLQWAEIVFCALPLTSLTEGIFTEELFVQNSRGCMFVNVSRGEVISLDTMENLLRRGIFQGFALDVYPQEKELAVYLRGGEGETGAACRIRTMMRRDDVILTPHNAFNTEEALQRKARQSVEVLAYFRQNGRFPHSLSR